MMLESGALEKEEAISVLIGYLFDENWHRETRFAAAKALLGVGVGFCSTVIGALGEPEFVGIFHPGDRGNKYHARRGVSLIPAKDWNPGPGSKDYVGSSM